MEIFKEYSLDELAKSKNAEAKSLINRYTDKEILENDTEKLEEEVFAKIKFEPVIIDEKSGKIIGKSKGRVLQYFDTCGETEVDSFDISVEYQFTGTSSIFGCYDNREINPWADALSVENDIRWSNNNLVVGVSVPVSDDVNQKLNQKLKDVLSTINQYLYGLNSNVESMNKELRLTIHHYLTEKKYHISKLDSIKID